MSERLICLGDSLTEGIGDPKTLGWVGRLANHFSQTAPDTWRVLNYGVAGDTSIDIKHRLITECIPKEPAKLIISAGINDTTHRILPDSDGSKVSLNYAKDIWRQTIRILKKNAIDTMFLGLPVVADHKLPLIWMPYDDTDGGHLAKSASSKKYEAMLEEEVTKAGFLFVPLFNRLAKTDYAKTLVDGLHPNAKGYDLLFKIIKEEGTKNGFFRPAKKSATTAVP